MALLNVNVHPSSRIDKARGQGQAGLIRSCYLAGPILSAEHSEADRQLAPIFYPKSLTSSISMVGPRAETPMETPTETPTGPFS